MPQRPLNVGMIGYGGIGRVHAMAYRDIPFTYALLANTVNIVGVATTRKETAERAAQEIGCDFFTDNYQDLLERPDIDLIDICTPNNSHKEIILAAARAGKHIYCEKPLAMDSHEAKEIVRAVSDAGIKTQLTFNFRFFPAILRAKQLINEGFLGRIFSFRGRYFRSSYIDPNKPLSWRLSKEVSGGGALHDLGSHIIDLLYFLLGEFESVQANVETFIKERPVSSGATEKASVDVDDFVLMNARLTNGAIGNIEISRMGTGVSNECIFEIYGDKGSIRFNAEDPSYLEVYDTRDAGGSLGGMRGFKKVATVGRFDDQRAPDGSMPTGFVRTHTECQYQFLKAIWENKDGAPNFQDGLHIQRIMDSALKAAETGSWENV